MATTSSPLSDSVCLSISLCLAPPNASRVGPHTSLRQRVRANPSRAATGYKPESRSRLRPSRAFGPSNVAGVRRGWIYREPTGIGPASGEIVT